MSFTVYKSSAGSGKTYTLVLEYLKLVLPEPERFRNILAITFTNKAANEMKERVLESLRMLSDTTCNEMPRADLMNRLNRETGLAGQEIELRAATALRLILHHYSDFAIGTIDGFSHRIMRTFARDFGLSINFLVSLESETLRQAAVDILLNRAGEDKDLTNLLVRFLETMIEENNGWNIHKIVTDFSKVLEDEEISQNLPKLKNISLADFQRIIHHFANLCREKREEILAPGKKAIDLIHREGISPEAIYRNSSGYYGYMQRIAKGDLKNLEVKKYLRETIDEDKWCSPRATPEERQKICAISGELRGFFTEFEILKNNSLPVLRFIEMMRKTLYPLGVLNLLGQIFDDFKKQNNLVQVGEFNRRISRIILEEPVPFIYERLGDRFRHILIDEFQDTSRLQWQNLLPLIENSLSTGGGNLVVGDGKQAIYRWRNGDVDQFVDLPSVRGSEGQEFLRFREQALKNHFSEKKLDRNFRSLVNIIRFNNDFFSFVKEKMKPENIKVYEEHVQLTDETKPGGYVQVEFLPKDGLTENTLVRIHQIIGELGSRNYALKDIAILCRDNEHASQIARDLMMQGIDVVSADSLLISFSAEVRFLVDCLRFLDKPDEKFVQTALLTWLFRKKYLKGTLPQNINRLTSRYAERSFLNLLDENGFELNLRHLASLPLYDLCEELIRIFRLTDPPDVYVQFFLDAVLAYTRQDSRGYTGFLEWWETEKKNLSLVIPEGLDAVSIMTIHKAKGLQFPVVICPFATQVLRNATKNYLWIDLPSEEYEGLPAVMIRPAKQMEETHFRGQYLDEMRKTELDVANMFYVAFTRPKEMLYIISSDPPPKNNGSFGLPSLLRTFLTGREGWVEKEGAMCFGEPVMKMISGDSPVKETLHGFISRRWRRKIRLRANAPLVWNVDDPQRIRAKGNLIHTVLSKISEAPETENVLDEMLCNGMISTAEMPGIREIIMKVIRHPDVAPFFTPGNKIMNEAEILSSDGSSFRPDRIIFKNEQVVLIDYKTGKNDEHHQNQLRNYGKLLHEMGFPVVKKYLLYLDPEVQLTEVD